MFSISCPIKQDLIIECLKKCPNEQAVFNFEEKNGIKLIFSSNLDDQNAMALAKKLIKNDPVGSVLYFQVQQEV